LASRTDSAAEGDFATSAKKLMIALVIPALNEGQIIGEVVRSIPPLVDRIIVVDNGSTDDTAKRAEEAGAIVMAQPDRGYGRACRAGMPAAIAAGVDIIVFIDGDGSDCPEFVEALVTPIVRNEYDFVIGSRIRGERETRQSNLSTGSRRALSRLDSASLVSCQVYRHVAVPGSSPIGSAGSSSARGNLRLELGNADVGGASESADPRNPDESSTPPGRSFPISTVTSEREFLLVADNLVSEGAGFGDLDLERFDDTKGAAVLKYAALFSEGLRNRGGGKYEISFSVHAGRRVECERTSTRRPAKRTGTLGRSDHRRFVRIDSLPE
jgi:hypothetical protein